MNAQYVYVVISITTGTVLGVYSNYEKALCEVVYSNGCGVPARISTEPVID